MGRPCVVPHCKSGYDSCHEKVSTFYIPKNKLEDWLKIIGRSDLSQNGRYTICEKHFRKKDIIRQIKTETYTYPLKYPKLSENAIPRIFPKKYEFRPRPKKTFSVIYWKRVHSANVKNINNFKPVLEEETQVASRDEFMNKLTENRANYSNLGSLSKEAYYNILVELNKKKKRKTTSLRKLQRQYEIIKIDGINKLVFPSYNSQNIKIYVHDDEIFDILQNAHLSLSHAGALKMSSELKKKYKNIWLQDIITYINLCPLCSNNEIIDKKTVKENTVRTKKHYCTELSKSCHIGLVDYQSNPDGEYQLILIYQNDITKYILLKPLRTFKDICTELCDIFAFIGVPATIHSNLENELMNDVIKKINLWPEEQLNHIKCEEGGCRIINTGKLIEHLEGWMDHNNTTKWSEGLCFIQFMINQDYNEDLSGSPYDTLFKLSSDDAEVNAGSISSSIKAEKIEMLSYVCEGCGNDIGNEETCICGISKSQINEMSEQLVIKRETSF